MTNKKRELIEILLDNVKPEDWPDNRPFAAQDKCDAAVYVYSGMPDISSVYNGAWACGSLDCKYITMLDVLCKHWNKTIVHRDEFMKRWNERNQVVDSDGWIQWNGGEMPVEEGTLIDVKYRRGLVNLHVKAGESPSGGSIPNRCAIDFKHDDNTGDIIAYRLHEQQQQKTPQQLALEKFGTDWHDNEGVQPVEMGIKIDIKFLNGQIEEGVNTNWRWGKFTGPHSIEKWRIHSDEKESQTDLSASQLAFDDGHMASEQVSESSLETQSDGIEKVIADRGINYGRFEDGAEIMQQLKLIAHTSQGWERMKPIQREGMDMILHKIGRILNGDPAYVDSWIDIEGYSKLVSDWLKGDSK